MTTSNSFATGPLKPSQSPITIRWPVEEIGRNSVTPSTSPSNRAVSQSFMAQGVAAAQAVRGAASYGSGRAGAIERVSTINGVISTAAIGSTAIQVNACNAPAVGSAWRAE